MSEGNGDSQAMTPDQQEALSVHYAQGLWVVPLASGAWAIFGPDRKLLLIAQTLREDLLLELSTEAAGQYEAEMALEASRRAEGPILASANVEDLGL